MNNLAEVCFVGLGVGGNHVTLSQLSYPWDLEEQRLVGEILKSQF